jgi:thiamine-monophosphate kinase
VTEATVREIGEFGLIAALQNALPPETTTGPELTIGIGDDCAVWTPPAGESVVATTDSLVEGVHFRLDWTDWARLGHKTLAVNLSDLASMGAAPGIAVITLALTGRERVHDLVAFYHGLGALAESSGVKIAGGDVVASPRATAFHVTALGSTRGGKTLLRSGARPGDVIAVSGTLGASAAGLELLRSGPGDHRRAATTAPILIDAHLAPQPRLALGEMLLREGASAAMDLSDGLYGDLPKILVASGVSARVDETAIPVAAAVRALFPTDWLKLATRGGEDYELLFTAPPDAFMHIQVAAAEIGATVTAIGDITEGEHHVLTAADAGGARRKITSGAFDHFR